MEDQNIERKTLVARPPERAENLVKKGTVPVFERVRFNFLCVLYYLHVSSYFIIQTSMSLSILNFMSYLGVSE